MLSFFRGVPCHVAERYAFRKDAVHYVKVSSSFVYELHMCSDLPLAW